MKLYLASPDYTHFQKVRTITHFAKKELSGINLLMVDVLEPIIGQNYGYASEDIYKFFLQSRFDTTELNRLNSFPIDVHVFFLKDPTKKTLDNIEDLQHLAWARLYDNRRQAKAATEGAKYV